MIHKTSNKIKSWDQRGREGLSLGPALQHYRCIQAIDSKTKALILTDTAEYLHKYLTQPQITAEDRMAHAIQFLTAALNDVPASIYDSQLAAIEAMREIFKDGKTIKSIQNKTSKAPLIPTNSTHNLKKINIAINSVDDQEPICKQTRSSRSTAQFQTNLNIQKQK